MTRPRYILATAAVLVIAAVIVSLLMEGKREPAPAPQQRPRAQQVVAMDVLPDRSRRVEEPGGEALPPPAIPEHVTNEHAKDCARSSDGPGCSLLYPSAETLDEMARCGWLEFDIPPMLSNSNRSPWTGKGAKDLGLTDREISQLDARSAEFDAQLNGELLAILGDLQADVSPAATPELRKRTEKALGSPKGEERRKIQKKLAEERAGWIDVEPGSDPRERFLRLLTTAGNRYEVAIAEVIGKERARRLREYADGWAQKSSLQTVDCEGNERRPEHMGRIPLPEPPGD